ncbi:MAG: GspH/FimT family pseudopilin [Gammaproteobacteria bacterium]|nr:GspH/FimT family pseudopilin [Gammaproteobacteria bacterium]MBU1655777.1 GspH/FimT family pseudopilin [Gammaproteobacteria bacterium]MBU1961131.1 GspH/FimT family pseudopilin [Gammaproteobacteria bacterium]
MDASSHCREQGLTLLELIITLLILGITLAIAVPSFAQLLANNSLTATLNEFTGIMNYAKSEAIKRRLRVVLCPSSDGSGCTATSSWHNGVILFVDADADSDRDASEAILSFYRPQTGAIGVYSGQKRKITYQPMGSTPGSNLTLTFCDGNRRTEARALILSNAGRLRSSDTKSDGSALICP